jgi:hypothetical protein
LNQTGCSQLPSSSLAVVLTVKVSAAWAGFAINSRPKSRASTAAITQKARTFFLLVALSSSVSHVVSAKSLLIIVSSLPVEDEDLPHGGKERALLAATLT